MEEPSARRHLVRAAVFLLGAVLSLGGGSEPAVGADAPVRTFQIYSQDMDEPENPNRKVYVLRTDTQRFFFLPPHRWEVRQEGTNQALLFTAPDLSAGIRLDLDVDTNTIPVSLEPVRLREAVLAGFSDSQIEREYACVVDGQKGVAFDLRKTLQHSTQAMFRLAYVPYPGGLAAFEMRTTTNHSTSARRALGRLMNSFRVEPQPTGR
jgi:hypothetical protein